MKKRILSAALVLCLIITSFGAASLAAGAGNLSGNAGLRLQKAAFYDNHLHTDYPGPRDTNMEIHDYSSVFTRWAHPTTNYLAKYTDGRMVSVEVFVQKKTVTVEIFDHDGQVSFNGEIPFELPLFGTFYSGEKYNYMAFGQENEEEDDEKEVIRIVKYDKDFNRLESASVSGREAYTTVPFFTGCPRIAERGDTLILHTSRRMYKAPDGFSPQYNLTIIADTREMTVLFSDVPQNRVSHSFNQYVVFDGADPVYLDHGDALPRSVILHKGTDDSTVTWPKVPHAIMFDIPGELGANQTGVTVGGLAVSSENYLTAISTVDHSKVTEYTGYEMIGLELDQRDIVICVLPKNYSNGDVASQITICKYVGTDTIASTPQLISNGDDTFTVMWREFALDHTAGAYFTLLIDGSGNPIGQRRKFDDILDFYDEFFSLDALPSDVHDLPPDEHPDLEPGLTDHEVYLGSREVSGVILGSRIAADSGSAAPALVSLKLDDSVDLGKLTTMAVMHDDGVLTAVPTRVCEDGSVLVLVRGSVMLLPLCIEADFKDIDMGAEYAHVTDEIHRAANLMIVEGRGNGIFDPSAPVTEREAAIMLLRAVGVPVDWDSAMEIARAHGLAGADAASGTPMPRADTAVMIVNALRDAGVKAQLEDGEAEEILSAFSDVDDLDDIERASLAICVKLGIFQGSGSDTMNPHGILQRSQVASLAVRMQDVILDVLSNR